MNFPFSFHWSVPLFLSSFVEIIVTHLHLFVNTFLSSFYYFCYCQFTRFCIELYPCKSDIRNPLSLFAHEHSHFLITQLHESILPELQSCLPGYQPMSHAAWTEPVPSHPYHLACISRYHDQQSFQPEK